MTPTRCSMTPCCTRGSWTPRSRIPVRPPSTTTSRCSYKTPVLGHDARIGYRARQPLPGRRMGQDRSERNHDGGRQRRGKARPPTGSSWRRAIAVRWSRSSNCSRPRGGHRSRRSTRRAIGLGCPMCSTSSTHVGRAASGAVPGICSAATTMGVAVRVTCPQEPMSRRRSTRSPPRSPRVGVAFPPRTGRIVAPRPPRPVVRPVP